MSTFINGDELRRILALDELRIDFSKTDEEHRLDSQRSAVRNLQIITKDDVLLFIETEDIDQELLYAKHAGWRGELQDDCRDMWEFARDGESLHGVLLGMNG